MDSKGLLTLIITIKNEEGNKHATNESISWDANPGLLS